jgi:hypothetical protein
MPSSLVDEEEGVSPRRDFGRDLVEVKLYSFGVTGFRVQDTPHRPDRSIGCVDRARPGDVNPSGPSDR